MNDDIALVMGTDQKLETSAAGEYDAIMQEFYDAERRLQEVYGHACTENLSVYVTRCRMTAAEAAEWGSDPASRDRIEKIMRGEITL